MALQNEAIVAGMKRALAAGQPISALTANPNFAALSEEQKREVLHGLRAELINKPESKAKLITTLAKGVLGGAAKSLPLGALVPVAVSMAQSGYTKAGLKGALEMAKNNRLLTGIMGTSMGIGAAGGLANAVIGLVNKKRQRDALHRDLAAVDSDEGLATALYGGAGYVKPTRGISTEPITSVLSGMTTPYLHASAMAGYHDAQSPDPSVNAAMAGKIKDKMLNGYPVDPNRVSELASRAAKAMNHRVALHGIISESPENLGLDPEVAPSILEDIAENSQREQANVEVLSQLADIAQQIRNQKRGV